MNDVEVIESEIFKVLSERWMGWPPDFKVIETKEAFTITSGGIFIEIRKTEWIDKVSRKIDISQRAGERLICEYSGLILKQIGRLDSKRLFKLGKDVGFIKIVDMEEHKKDCPWYKELGRK